MIKVVVEVTIEATFAEGYASEAMHAVWDAEEALKRAVEGIKRTFEEPTHDGRVKVMVSDSLY